MRNKSMAVLGATLIFGLLSGSVLVTEAKEDDAPDCYAVANITIHDREEYRKYEAGFGAIFQKYGGTLVAFSEEPEVLEGEWPYTRFVLLRFDSREALDAWYQSQEYRGIVGHRWAASKADIIVLEGR